jgi:hypothetical protein
MRDRHFTDEPCTPDCAPDCPVARRGRARTLAYRQHEWSPLELRREPGGWRHYLDGAPVHCGDALILQAIESRYDDYGHYPARLNRGTTVRYEGEQLWNRTVVPVATLYHMLDGHMFTAPVHAEMRFRWGKR